MELDIEVRVTTTDHWIARCAIADLSASGARLRGSIPFLEGELLQLVLWYGSSHPLAVTAEVVRVEPCDGVCDAGVRFLDVPDRVQDLLQQTVLRALERQAVG